jgi:hypothetical protein
MISFTQYIYRPVEQYLIYFNVSEINFYLSYLVTFCIMNLQEIICIYLSRKWKSYLSRNNFCSIRGQKDILVAKY